MLDKDVRESGCSGWFLADTATRRSFRPWQSHAIGGGVGTEVAPAEVQQSPGSASQLALALGLMPKDYHQHFRKGWMEPEDWLFSYARQKAGSSRKSFPPAVAPQVPGSGTGVLCHWPSNTFPLNDTLYISLRC